MPFRFECRDHPDWRGGHRVDVDEHGVELHDGLEGDELRELGVVTSSFVSQNVAQGNPDRYMRMCRTCNERFETLDPARAEQPYCDAHLT